MGLEFGRRRIDRAGVINTNLSAAATRFHGNRGTAGVVNNHIATGAEGDNPAGCVHFTGILKEVTHENDVAALAGNGAVVLHPGGGVATEAIGGAAEEIFIAHIERRESHHPRDIDHAALPHDDPAGIHHDDIAIGRLELAVNLSRVPRHDPVKGRRVARLIDSRDLAALDRERLPVDNGLLGEVVDVEARGPESLEIHITGDDLLTVRIRAKRHRHEDQSGGERHKDQHLEQKAPAKFWREVFHIKKWGDEGERGGSLLPAPTSLGS